MRGGRGPKERARALRANMTDTERALWRELRNRRLGGRFRRQFPIPPYVVDFACIEGRLIVEADGGQHARPGDHDNRDSELRRQGWRVLRFWNNDILTNRTGVLQAIMEALGEQNPHPNPPPLAGEGVSARDAVNRDPAAIADDVANGFVTNDPDPAGGTAGRRDGQFPPPQAGEG
jgi:very-short-patch-repair endonuclease